MTASALQRLHQVHCDAAVPTPWRNGGGQTRQLLIRPEESKVHSHVRDWQLRISLADIDRNGPFSAFPGTQRWFGVVAGLGVLLRFGQSVHALTPDSPALQFDGATAPECSLLDGPTRDLNLMHRSGTASMQQVQANVVWDEPFSERGLFTTSPGTLHLASDEAVSLPAYTLSWWLGPGPCRFEPRAPRRAGWWLGWSPDTTERA